MDKYQKNLRLKWLKTEISTKNSKITLSLRTAQMDSCMWIKAAKDVGLEDLESMVNDIGKCDINYILANVRTRRFPMFFAKTVTTSVIV